MGSCFNHRRTGLDTTNNMNEFAQNDVTWEGCKQEKSVLQLEHGVCILVAQQTRRMVVSWLTITVSPVLQGTVRTAIGWLGCDIGVNAKPVIKMLRCSCLS